MHRGEFRGKEKRRGNGGGYGARAPSSLTDAAGEAGPIAPERDAFRGGGAIGEGRGMAGGAIS